MNEEFLVVKDLEEFIDASRRLVFNLFGSSSEKHDDMDLLSLTSKDEEEELDSVLSYQECLVMAKSILKKQKNRRTEEIRYLVSDSLYREMLEIFNSRLVSNLLGNLVNKGLIETAYDDESNDFVFWISDNDKKQKEKPETD